MTDRTENRDASNPEQLGNVVHAWLMVETGDEELIAEFVRQGMLTPEEALVSIADRAAADEGIATVRVGSDSEPELFVQADACGGTNVFEI